MTAIAQLVFNGLLVGSILALGAIGLTLVYRILNLVNFAHGDLLTIGAYAGWVVVAGLFSVAGWQLIGALGLILAVVLAWDGVSETSMREPDRWLLAGTLVVIMGLAVLHYASDPSPHVTIASGLIVSAVFVGLVSMALEAGLFRGLRKENANLLTLMIISIGLAFVLRSLVQMAFGAELRVFFRRVLARSPTVDAFMSWVGLEAVRVSIVHVWVLGTALVAGLATYAILNHTRSGKAMRALSDDIDLAKVAGIDVDRVVMHVWVLGGALAGVAGALLAMMTSLHVNLGWFNLLPLFAAVILGGVGSVRGAMLGGLLIGLFQELSVPVLALMGLSTGYKVAVGFGVLIGTLLVRPEGIMGVKR